MTLSVASQNFARHPELSEQQDIMTPDLQFSRLPPEAEFGDIHTTDGLRLRAMTLPGISAAKGTLFLVQGRAEFIEKYAEIINRLGARGFGVLAFDWRGQGGSTRQLADSRKGHVEDFEDYLLDLQAVFAFATARNLPKPWSILAHSMGGAIVLEALARGLAPVSRACLSSPMVEFRAGPLPILARWLARFLCSLGLSTRFVPGGKAMPIGMRPFAENPLTSDPRRYQMLQARLKAMPELAIGDPTVGWVDAAFDATAQFRNPDFGATNRIPVLILTAGNDEIVNSATTEALAARMRGTHAIRIPGARHEILIETDAIQAQVWAAFDAFIPGTELDQLETQAAAPDNSANAAV